MAQTPLLKIGDPIKLDGNMVTVKSIHKGYIVAEGKKGKSKVFDFKKIEAAILA